MKKILVVENERPLRPRYKEELEKDGYKVSTAANAGTFINLKVSVKGKDYRVVVHRAGYFAGS